MGKMNEALAKLIRERGLKKAEIARKLGGVTAQAVGNYAKKRGIPADFVAKWKAKYGDDLIALSETDVPHETKSKQPLTFNPIDKLVSTLEMDKAKQQEEIIWQRKLIDKIVVRICDLNDSSIEEEPPVTNGK